MMYLSRRGSGTPIRSGILPNRMRGHRQIAIFILMLGLQVSGLSSGVTSPTTQKEIDHLLVFVRESKCDFNRNGQWYTSRKAENHLRGKYEYAVKHHAILSAEDFIEKVATKSSWSGHQYLIRCGSAAVIPSGGWLTKELMQYRDRTPK